MCRACATQPFDTSGPVEALLEGMVTLQSPQSEKHSVNCISTQNKHLGRVMGLP
jgi:hypothetical protein